MFDTGSSISLYCSEACDGTTKHGFHRFWFLALQASQPTALYAPARFLLFMLASLLVSSSAFAQPTLAMHTHAGMGPASACVPGRWDGLIELASEQRRGTLRHPVTTSSATAQGYFDQGLIYLYGFDNESAMRSFHQASIADPKSAMAHWGTALAAGGDLNIPIDDPCLDLAREEVQKAQALATSATDPEKRYIHALSVRYEKVADKGQRTLSSTLPLSIRYANRMRDLYKTDAGRDADAAGLFIYALMDIHPWEWWNKSGVPAEEIVEATEVARLGLQRFPGHIGLNHVYIHAMEEAPIEKAILPFPSANYLAQNAPEITPHLSHMPAHTYLLMGQWDSVVAANEKAVARDQVRAQACAPDHTAAACNQLLVGHYYTHDMLFLSVGYGNQGLWEKIDPLAKTLEENAKVFVSTQPMLEHYLTTRVMMLVHFGKWKELNALPMPEERPSETSAPAPSIPNPCPANIRHLERAVWYFGQAMAHISLNQPEVPYSFYVEKFRKERGCVKQSGMYWGNNRADDILAVADARIEQRISTIMPGEVWARIYWAKQAVEAEDALVYDEPPGWYVSSRETLGAAYLLSGDYQNAKQTFMEDLARRPNNARSLFGLWKIAERTRAADAGDAERAFRAQWRSTVLPELGDM